MASVSGPLGSWTLSYDDESRLSAVTYPGGSESFAYNALGQRMRAVVNGTATRYVYYGERVLEETNDAGTLLVRYTLADSSYFAPMLHLKRADGTVRYPLYEGIGSIRRLVDSAGVVTDNYTFDAFGRLPSSTGTTPNPYRYGGAWGYMTQTPGSGLQQLGARYYWPETGRFIQQDPAGDGMNWYAYVGSNPVSRIDPEGLYWETLFDVAMTLYDIYALVTNPNQENAAALGVDAASVALPVPAVGGMAIRGGAKAAKAARGAKACGRLGGAAHRAKVAKTADRLAAQGYDIIAGGGRMREKAVETARGIRYPDVIAAKSGQTLYANIGKTLKSGPPVARERRALEDLGAINRTYFMPY